MVEVPLMFGQLLSLLLLPLFLGFCLGILAAWIGARLTGSGESLNDILRLTGGTIKRTATATARTSMIKPLALILVGFVAGLAVGNFLPFGVDGQYVKIHLIREGAESQSFWAEMWENNNSAPKEGWATFCNDFPTPFKAGMVLSDVKFLNRGYCWSVAGKRYGYYIINRNENGIPKLEAINQ